MVDVKILGPGCPNCRRLEDRVRRVVKTNGLEVSIEKVTDIVTILGYGVMGTPGLVVDGTVVSYARIPTDAEIAGWLS
jgi:small redox-active disulfide protein 2